MQAVTELLSKARAQNPNGMTRLDRTGRALIISDAPRRGATLHLDAHMVEDNGLVYIDFPEETYRAFLSTIASAPRVHEDGYFNERSLLHAILRVSPMGCTLDEPLLRFVCVALTHGKQPLLNFFPLLRQAHAIALRKRDTLSVWSAAALIVQHPIGRA